MLRRDRVIILAALALIGILAWIYIVYLAEQMSMGGMDMTGFRMAMQAAGMVMRPAFEPWTATEFVFTLAMWTIMMIGMMTPAATPVILLYARVGRQAAADNKPFASTGWFVSGYLLAWAGFSLAATILQWVLDRAALLTPTMGSASAVFGGMVLIAAGIYQWSRFKENCLSHCQMPLPFIQRAGGFPRDPMRSLRMGAWHGTCCVGCCWALMALLFVGGVMNVLWIAGLTILVLAEKLTPGRFLPRLAGTIFMLGGAWLLATG